MTPLICVLVLLATVAAGAAGFAAASLVALITGASRLRYLAYSAALGVSFVPFPSGLIRIGAPQVPHGGSSAMPPALMFRCASDALVHSGLGALEHGAPALLAAYALGAAACLIRLGLRWAALRRVVRSASHVDPERLGDRRSVLPVRVTANVRSALLVGIRSPIAVLPAQALSQMTGSQLEWVLAHEEAHARRGDNLRLLIEEVLRAVLWFNPFVAWAAIRAAEAREQLCDRAVLRGADALKRRAYAETLLFAFRLGSQSQLASALINPRKRDLVGRFDAILNPAGPTPTRAAASVGLVAAGGLLACVASAAAWAQAPETFMSPWDGPADVKSDRVVISGCETTWLGNVTVHLGNRSLEADQLHIVADGKPKACGALLTGEAHGNVVHEDHGQVERGQIAHLNFQTGSIALN
ncbi:MAG: M56 family metallopeptidase [Caulobacteraceae bacterium]